MFSHVMLGVKDMEVSKAFYDSTFQAIGGKPGFADDKGRIIYVHGGGIFMLSKPIDGEPACHANGGTIGFAMASPEQTDAWHEAGVAAGGVACEDPPGIRDSALGKLYLAYMRDPAGNKLCGLHQLA
jgi:catechol 2,3-dioxygenase-like lactoylglutathione lyase family enzyme